MLGLFRKLFSNMGGENFLVIKVKCKKCGEEITARINPRTDLLVDYSTGGYELHKELLGVRCPNLVRFHGKLDRNYNLLDYEIEGGELVEFGKG